MTPEIKKYVNANVDRFTIVMFGQPRYVGNKNWVDDHLGFFKTTKENYPDIPIDIIFVCWEYDVHNTEWGDPNKLNYKQFGLPVTDIKYNPALHSDRLMTLHQFVQYDEDNKLMYGKVKANKTKFENVMNSYFDFVDNIKFHWIDPYSFSQKITNTANQKFDTDVPWEAMYGWQNQHFAMESVFLSYRPYFENVLTKNSIILKTRYDLTTHHFHPEGNTTHLFDLGVCAVNFHLNLFKGNNINDWPPNLGILHDFQNLNLFPAVGISSDSLCILRGATFSSDFWYIMDKSAFKIYSTKYKDWVFENWKFRSSINSIKSEDSGFKEPGLFYLKTKPETSTNEFFLNNDFSLVPLCLRHGAPTHPDLFSYRVKYDEFDFHRSRFYEWPEDVLNKLFNLDYSIDKGFYKL